jgi:acetoacetyl-CoA synthetase
VPYIQARAEISQIPNAVFYEDFVAKEAGLEIEFAQLPFDHPQYIMFSSGTTDKPKCMVQSAGGVLINHLKELLLHTDLRRQDTILYITSCSWMMWNWLVSALAVGATIVLYDGNPNFPDTGAMWKLIEDEKVTVFGCSASYIHMLKKQGERPDRFDLSSLREISQTGSALSLDGFEYVYSAIKSDLHLNSISGGTDINGCFVAGSPILPVYAGELQSPALGMKIMAYDATGKPVTDEQAELVCEKPAPSMPLYFWNDPDGSKYQHAYFDVFPGVWRHGDYVLIHSDTGGVTFYGRSDAVLKPSGVRIGTAEIYAQLEKLPELLDSLAIGQDHQGDQRMILFVKLADGQELTEALKDKIRKSLRDNASPRHVPALIIAAPDIPYTMNMKKVESSVTNILNRREVTNREALINPGSLDFYEGLVDQLQVPAGRK